MFDQETFRPQMHAALGEISALVFDAPSFREASFRFRDPIGPGDNRTVSIRPVTVGGEPKWQLARAGLAENKGRGAAKKELWELANSVNILLEAHASAEDGAALHMRVTKKGHVLLQRVRAPRGAAPAGAPAAAVVLPVAARRRRTTAKRTIRSRASIRPRCCSRSASRGRTAR